MSNDIGDLGTPIPKPKKRRGFACMPPEKVREWASMGGKKAHELGHAHEFTSEEARVHGRKGGLATHAKLRAARTLPRPDGA